MIVTCSKCLKTFNLYSSNAEKFNITGLCGKCRPHKKNNSDRYRKTNTCPSCGKTILNISKFCRSCRNQDGENNPYYKNGRACRSRKCSECGEHISAGSEKGKCLSCYIKTLKGETNPNYRFGHYTGEFTSTVQYRDWRTEVFSRDNYTCADCGKTHNLNAHHIKPKRLYPDLVYEVSNGITLCEHCHEQTYNIEETLIDYYENKLKLINRPIQNSVNLVNGENPNTKPN